MTLTINHVCYCGGLVGRLHGGASCARAHCAQWVIRAWPCPCLKWRCLKTSSVVRVHTR